MDILYLFILAFAVSLDSFGVGITYGLRKVKIPITSIFLICIASAISILLAMSIGEILILFISPAMSKWLGAFILIGVGLFAIKQVITSANKENEKETVNRKVFSIELKKIGLVIQILKTPMKADIDNSGKITSIEALFLGIALSLDAFGAGLGAALIGFNPFITAFTIAIMSGIFILIGMKLGFWTSEKSWIKRFSIIPGLILIIVGLLKII